MIFRQSGGSHKADAEFRTEAGEIGMRNSEQKADVIRMRSLKKIKNRKSRINIYREDENDSDW